MVYNGIATHMVLCDTAGQEEYSSLRPLAYTQVPNVYLFCALYQLHMCKKYARLMFHATILSNYRLICLHFVLMLTTKTPMAMLLPNGKKSSSSTAR